MIKALEEEIDSIKKSGGSNQIALSDGTRTGHIGTYFIYTFFTNTEVTITADTPAHLRVDNQSPTPAGRCEETCCKTFTKKGSGKTHEDNVQRM
jgi:hypothetical protein